MRCMATPGDVAAEEGTVTNIFRQNELRAFSVFIGIWIQQCARNSADVSILRRSMHLLM